MRKSLSPETKKEVLQLSESSSSWKMDSSSGDSTPVEVSTDIRNHGTLLHKKKGAKKIRNYSRLKKHLGGNASPCVEVPEVQIEKDSQPTLSRKRKHDVIVEYSGSEQKDEMLQALRNPKKKNKVRQRCIGRFFIENGIGFSFANSSSFKNMVHTLVGSGSTAFEAPSCDDLKGWILEEELKATQEHVQKVVCSWGSTGCSILLDGWTSESGQNIINFVVDSPQGPIFWKSDDVSDSIGDVDAMISLISGVIDEVGVQNVVQIVTYTTAGSMEAVGKQMTEKYKSIFWTVCASHCIGLMLEKIGMMGTGRGVISNAKAITKFIYSQETVLNLMRKHTSGVDLVSSSRIRSLMPFQILETIKSQKKNLRKMFASPDWKESTLASTTDGRMVSGLVTRGPSFWTGVEMLLKASVPLICALHLLNNGEDNRPQLGYIYETMDQVKEQIKKNHEGRETKYQPLWTVIDGIWDDQLHSPIHAAGYYLNPGLFYFDDFYADSEVKTGFLCCIVRIVEDKREQDLIAKQFKEYRTLGGTFGCGNAIDRRARLAPVEWWSLYGVDCPELQRFAIRILSQTCTGALRYGLKRSLTEELHKKGRNSVEKKRLTELTFVHHNLRLRNLPASNSGNTDIFLEPIDPMDEWIAGMEEKAAKQIGNV